MSSLDEFFEQQRQYSPNKSAVKRRADWKARLAKPQVRGGRKARPDDLVKVDSKLQYKIARAIGEACPMISEPFNDTLGELALNAFKWWPVETGMSKSMLALEYKYESNEMRGILKNTAPYAYMIKSLYIYKKKPKGNPRTAPVGRRKPKSDPNVGGWLKIGNNPASGRALARWRAATFKTSRWQVPVSYAGVQATYKQMDSTKKISAYDKAFSLVASGTKPDDAYNMAVAEIQKGKSKTRGGKNVAQELVFKPGKTAADELMERIFANIAREFSL